MHKDLTKELQSSFLSCEKDTALILKRLFVDSRPHSDILKKLLVISTKDCLDKTGPHADLYNKKIKDISIAQLMKDKYIVTIPKLPMAEFEERKSCIIISFDNFTMNDTNPQFRDCSVYFEIICPTDCWELNDHKLRPLAIAGYIDGILNNTHLTGIGRFVFMGCNQQVYDENLSGYTLVYRAVHGSDDIISPKEN